MSYWLKTGLHQSTLNRLLRLKDEATQKEGKIPEKWWLLDAASGLYYGLFNDGDNAKGAAKNNRIYHTYRTLRNMYAAVIKIGNLPKTETYLNDATLYEDDEDRLKKEAEDMMDEIAVYYDQKYAALKSQYLCYACDAQATCAWSTQPSYQFCGKECAQKTWNTINKI